MEKTKAIRLQNLSIGYKKTSGNISILKNIHLDFSTGDFIGLVGLNGIGKSTLLKTISGLLPPLSGHVNIDSKSISGYALNELAKKVSIVLTEKIGGFNLSAFDTVAAGQIPYTNSFNRLEKHHIAIVQQAMKATGIDTHQHKLLNELSDGLFQKTMIAKALAQQTQSILLDEPTAFLDYASKHELFLLLKSLCEKENKTILVSCHDLDLILKYCHKVLIISDGNVELISVSEVANNEGFKKIGGGFL
jgi:iron complex transport system ATP-binding protein